MSEEQQTEVVDVTPGTLGGQEAHVNPEAAAAAVEETAQAEALIGGKFKTNDDLLAAYQALETKLGANDGDADGEEEASTETGTAEEASGSEEGSFPKEVREELTAAGVDMDKASAEFDETGTLSEDTFKALEKSQYSRPMVEAYLEGLKTIAASSEAAAQVTEANINEVKAAAGEGNSFEELQAWIKTGADEADRTAYNEAVSTGDLATAKAAVADMAAKRAADVGSEGKLLGGQGDVPANEGFANEAEYLEAMKSPQYKTSEAYRSAVYEKLARSTGVFATR